MTHIDVEYRKAEKLPKRSTARLVPMFVVAGNKQPEAFDIPASMNQRTAGVRE
jgi:hypothetical protein